MEALHPAGQYEGGGNGSKHYLNQTDEQKGFHDNIEERFLKAKKLKLALVSIPNFGHITHIHQLAKALVARGHEIHLITIGNERKEKIQKMFESLPEVSLIFTEGPP